MEPVLKCEIVDSVSNNGQLPQRSSGEKSSTVSEKESHSVTKRLQHELFTVVTAGDKGISAFPEGDSLFRWMATINGPIGTAYENLVYKLMLEFPGGYPYKPPSVIFITPCFHPNVDSHGNICLDILKERWSALYDARSILLSVQSLLGDPNNESPLNAQAAELWSNQEAYKKLLLDKYYKESKSSK